MGQVIVRRAVSADAAAIQALYHELVGNTGVSVLPERVADMARDQRTALLVAEEEGAVVGTALVSLCMDAMFGTQPFAVVENVVVSHSRRGSGIGAALMEEVERFCLAAQCSKIMLLSSAHRHDAHRFLEREGYCGSAKKGFVKYRRQFAT